MASSDLRDELTCSICLNIYTDPVTLRCGHSFCRTCIEDAMEAKEGPGAYKCPECRAEYKGHPALEKNRKLRNIAETFRSSHPEQEDVGILCTYCDSPVPAVKTCLLCETSLCDKHVMKHSKSEEHVLIEPTASLENRKCPIHKKVLEYYCLEDATCVCVSCCLIGEHRGHQMELLHEASEKKKAKMQNILGGLISEKTKTEKDIESVQKNIKGFEDSTELLMEETSALFMGIREQLETLEKRVLSQIRRYGDKFLNIFSCDMPQLEIKMEELSRKVGHIEELCNTTDPLAVLQGFKLGDEEKSDADSNNFGKIRKSIKEGSDEDEGDNENDDEDGVDEGDNENDGDEDDEDGDEDDEDGDESGDEMRCPVGEYGLIFATIQTGLEEVVTWAKRQCNAGPASNKFIEVDMISNILLDVDTSGNNTAVSGDGKTMTFSNIHQGRPEGPKMFMVPQVLSTTGFSSGIHYWEVEGSPSGGWRVGVTYLSIDREGVQAVIGNNNKSWALEMNRYSQYIVTHNNKRVLLPVTPSCYRLGIFLHYAIGYLSFYELGDRIQLLHTFMASFSEPLHIAICTGEHGWVKIRR